MPLADPPGDQPRNSRLAPVARRPSEVKDATSRGVLGRTTRSRTEPRAEPWRWICGPLAPLPRIQENGPIHAGERLLGRAHARPRPEERPWPDPGARERDAGGRTPRVRKRR